MTWTDKPEAKTLPLTPTGIVRAVLRGIPLGLLVFGGLVILLALRLVERPMWGLHRPWTPHITQFVCRNALRLLGIGYEARGAPMTQMGAVVANHASWLDIFALNAQKRVYFVAKAEVAGWAGIGWLARAVGTVFIRRDPRDAAKQRAVFEERLTEGHKLLFFPEGTSSDGLRILPFKSTLFAAFFTNELRDICFIQPATVIYRAPAGQSDHFYGWWGDMDFAPHLMQTLAAARQGTVEVIYHAPLKVSDFPNRKALAAACEDIVRAGLNPEARSGS